MYVMRLQIAVPYLMCAGEQKEHSPPPGALVMFSTVFSILVPDTKLHSFTYFAVKLDFLDADLYVNL